MNKRSRIDIYGAGLSGIFAAIYLAKNDFKVHVYDNQRRIGGNPKWHPSIQTTILNPEKTWEYIGINLSHCFEKVDEIIFHRYGRKKVFTLDNMFVCERGPRKGALDYELFKIAEAKGVNFHFENGFDLKDFGESKNVIIATGLENKTYKKLELPVIPIFGYRGIIKSTDHNRILISYMLKCTNYDFAYLAAKNGLLFALLFSRKEIKNENLIKFKKILKETENISIDKWTYSTGAIPDKMRLFHKNYVLTGSLSGMIDPFVLHGISGALTSGKVAAEVFIDKNKAQQEFKWLSKNYYFKKGLKEVSTLLPFKSFSTPFMMLLDAHLRGVGFVK